MSTKLELKSELKSANLTGTPECQTATRGDLMDGKWFFTEAGGRIYYDDTKGTHPFRVTYPTGRNGCANYLFADMTTWQVEVDWFDNLSDENPRWCWVWNDEPDYVRSVRVQEYDLSKKYHYMCDRYRWKNAKPLPIELSDALEKEYQNEQR